LREIYGEMVEDLWFPNTHHIGKAKGGESIQIWGLRDPSFALRDREIADSPGLRGTGCKFCYLA
jgi:hypothetical protein